MQGIGTRNAWSANEAVLKALKARDRQLRTASQMDVLQRVRDCIEQGQRVKLLVQAGELRAAREQLRVGKLSHLRLDMKDAAEVLSTARPSFDRFEALEVTGMLEALDASLRRGAQDDAVMETQMLLTQLREISQELSVGMPLP